MPEDPTAVNVHKRVFGLIGYPLSHSFSKNYFTKKFEREGITDCSYELFSIDSIKKIRDIIRSQPLLKGLNVTVPYKKEVLTFLDSTENIPAGLQACNCIYISGEKLIGYNTDHTGFQKSLEPLLKKNHSRALVLGNGGSAAAVLLVLKRLGIDFTIVSRALHNGSAMTYKDLDEKIMLEHPLIINTTPVGMYPGIEACPDIPYPFITGSHLLFDLIYNPAKTLFLQKGEERGATIKNGEEMLVVQAEESWRIWNQ